MSRLWIVYCKFGIEPGPHSTHEPHEPTRHTQSAQARGCVHAPTPALCCACYCYSTVPASSNGSSQFTPTAPLINGYLNPPLFTSPISTYLSISLSLYNFSPHFPIAASDLFSDSITFILSLSLSHDLLLTINLHSPSTSSAGCC